MGLRREMLASFADALSSVGVLNRFQFDGVVATWWEEVRYDLRALSGLGADGLLDSWCRTTIDGLEAGDANVLSEDSLGGQLLRRLIPEDIAELVDLEIEIADLKQQKEAFEAGETIEVDGTGELAAEDDNAEDANYAKPLGDRLKALRASIKDEQAALKKLQRGRESIDSRPKRGVDLSHLESGQASLEAAIAPAVSEIAGLEELLAPYTAIKKQLTTARKRHRGLGKEIAVKLLEARERLNSDESQRVAAFLLKGRLHRQLRLYVTEAREELVGAFETWFMKYKVPMCAIEADLAASTVALHGHFVELGYVR
jgi:type I restriction enzyme M protein